MTSLMAAVRAFYAEKAPNEVLDGSRYTYFLEELREFMESYDNPGTPHRAKEAADLLFTLAGLMDEEGIDLDVAFRLVCESNMTKERTLSGKVQKGADYVEPDMREAMVR